MHPVGTKQNSVLQSTHFANVYFAWLETNLWEQVIKGGRAVTTNFYLRKYNYWKGNYL